MNVYTDGVDTVVAESIEDADAAWAESYGGVMTDRGDLDPWELVPPQNPITINYVGDGDECRSTETRTAAQWANENGRGLLCSTEF